MPVRGIASSLHWTLANKQTENLNLGADAAIVRTEYSETDNNQDPTNPPAGSSIGGLMAKCVESYAHPDGAIAKTEGHLVKGNDEESSKD